MPPALSDLAHAVQFLQTAYTILLALAFGEGFKQFVSETGSLKWWRLPSLLALIFLIVPFFHGMSRYFYVTYLSKIGQLSDFAGLLMFDGISFMFIASLFFIMSRSLSLSHWKRFYVSLLCLLAVDSVWIAVSIYRGIQLAPWLYLNAALAVVLVLTLLTVRAPDARTPPIICAVTTFVTGLAAYVWMSPFYFP